jgi:C1A family cysteine protease
MRKYNVVKDSYDARDFMFGAIARPVQHPSAISLISNCPPVYDQRNLGSCTGNGIGFCYEYDLIKQGLPVFMPSRLYIYYNERLMEGDVAQDDGAQIRDGIQTIATNGVCSEDVWPYDESKFAVQPPPEAYAQGKLHTAVNYYRVNVLLNDIKTALCNGYPIVCGITIFDSFESQAVAESGDAPMPGPSEQMLGGHCVAIVGYDDAAQRIILRNSWGDGWGKNGYFTLPYGYINTQLMQDCWCVAVVK